MKSLILVFLLLTFTGGAMAIEEPKFTVESKSEAYEIRKYAATLVAETEIESTFGEAGNQAFGILADYIFGNNTTEAKIAMTAPVSQQASSQKIAMTAPVSQVKTNSGYLVQFTMPAEFTLESLPKPKDPRVKIVQIPERRVAVYKYSGSWSESRYNEKLSEFKAALEKDKILTVGEPIFSRFNSPYQLWFLRRNEIWWALKD